MELKRGSAESTLDDKGRVNIPVRFREFFQGELVITRGMEHCALIMTPAVWERFEQAEGNSDVLNHEEREVFRNKHLNQAQVVELDKAGRIAVPSIIRKYANLRRDCIVIREEDRLLIWDSGDFEAYLTEKDTVARAAMNKLGSQDIFNAKQGKEWR
jgi:MraZ protein